MFKTIRSSITLAAAVMAVAPALASAIPNNGGSGGSQPIDEPPVGAFTISPNPALAGSFPEAAKARAAEFGGGRFGGGDLVTFDATGSTDEHGITKYEWDLDGNGSYEVSGATKSTTTRRYLGTGTFQVRLRVSDASGITDVVTHTLIVHRAPTAKVAAGKAAVLVGQTVDYSAAGSSDDNGIAKYEWDLDGDGTYETDTGTTPAATSSYATIGERTVGLRVTDVYGARGTAQVKVLVHRAPTAAFSFAPAPAIAGQPVTFDGSGSTDDGKIAVYEWDLDGDGTFETNTQGTPTVKKTFDAPGTFTVRLRVTDDNGAQDAISRTVTVDPAPVPTTTGSGTTDTMAPIVRITPGSAKLRKAGFVVIRVTCPEGEATCAGRLSLRSLRGAQISAVGGVRFALAGGRSTALRVGLSKSARRSIAQGRRLRTRATATATDAAGNAGTSRRLVTIHR